MAKGPLATTYASHHLRGTAAELRRRKERLEEHQSANTTEVSQGATSTKPSDVDEPKANEHDEEDEDICAMLSRAPTDQRLLALEQSVFTKHDRMIFGMNMKIETLENHWGTLFGDYEEPGVKATRYDMST